MSSTAVASAAFLAAAVAGTAIVALIDAKRREATAKLRAGAAPVASDGSGASGAAAGAGAGAGAGSSGALKPWDKPNKPHKPFSMGEVTVRTNLKIDEVHVLRVPHLNDELPDLDAKICNTVRLGQRDDSGAKLPYNNLITKDAVILGDIVRVGGHAPVSRGFVRAGVRPSLYFDPATTKAAIVTCGGLCPGLNNVIRQIVRDLHYLYGVDTVLGIRDGFSGFHDGTPPRLLTMDFVKSMHRFGGSCIGSGRGGFDAGKIIKFLQDNAVNVLFVVGGDGTLRAANALHTEVHARNLPICIAGVPKTIDSDVGIIDRSFGFTTAVAEAVKAIKCAKTEAVSAKNGIGLVKVMGREAGFIAAHAALASGDVDVCIVPEVCVRLRGDSGVFPHIKRRLQRRGNAVVVLAEGACQDLIQDAPTGTDAGGNKILPPVGPFMKDAMTQFFKEEGMEVTIKYIDPSYMIRSVPANPSDAMYCMMLGQNVVHGAMAGYTGFSVGLVNNRMVMLPIKALCENSPRIMDASGRTWERVVSMTGQPAASMEARQDYAAAYTTSGSGRL